MKLGDAKTAVAPLHEMQLHRGRRVGLGPVAKTMEIVRSSVPPKLRATEPLKLKAAKVRVAERRATEPLYEVHRGGPSALAAHVEVAKQGVYSAPLRKLLQVVTRRSGGVRAASAPHAATPLGASQVSCK